MMPNRYHLTLCLLLAFGLLAGCFGKSNNDNGAEATPTPTSTTPPTNQTNQTGPLPLAPAPGPMANPTFDDASPM